MIVSSAGRTGDAAQSMALADIETYYNASAWIYSGVYAIATRLAAVPIYATRMVNGKPEDQRDSPLQGLIDNPSEGLSRTEYLQSVLSYTVLTGFGSAFVERRSLPSDSPEEIALNPEGEIQFLSPMRTSRVGIRTPDSNNPAEMRSTVGNVYRYWHDVNGKKLFMHPSNVLAMKTFNPRSDFWGLSAVEVVKAVVEGDDTLLATNNSLLEQGGVPDVALQTDQRLEGGVAHRKRFQWEQRYRKGVSGGVVVLDNGLKVVPLGFSPKDMQYETLASMYQRRILAALGVPPMLIMDLRDASVLANADVQLRLFYTQTLMPYGTMYADSFTRVINTDPRFPAEQGWGIRWAWDEVDELSSTRKAEREQLRLDWSGGAITLNEYRMAAGYTEVEDGDRYFTTGSQAGGLGGLLSLSHANDATTIKLLPQSTDAFKNLARSAHRQQFKVALPALHKGIAAFFKEQAKRVGKRFNTHYKAHLSGKYDTGALASIFPLDDENDRLREKFGPLFLDAFVEAARAKQGELFPDSDFEAIGESNELVSDFMDKWSATQIVNINDETRALIRDQLIRSFGEGTPVNTLQAQLEGMFARFSKGPADAITRAERVARTETNVALNSGSYTAALDAQEAGVKILKQWLSSRDGLVRESHRAMDSQTSGNPIPLNKSFSNGLRFPSDPNGPPEEVINCRCSLVETVSIPGVTTP